MDKITEKERTIYELICKNGVTKPKEIARIMDIPVNTVRDCLHEIYRKTNKHSIAELIYSYWIRNASTMKEIIRKGIMKYE